MKKLLLSLSLMSLQTMASGPDCYPGQEVSYRELNIEFEGVVFYCHTIRKLDDNCNPIEIKSYYCAPLEEER